MSILSYPCYPGWPVDSPSPFATFKTPNWLMVWNMFCFPIYCPFTFNNHSNWRTHIFQRGRYTTNPSSKPRGVRHRNPILGTPAEDPPALSAAACPRTSGVAADAVWIDGAGRILRHQLIGGDPLVDDLWLQSFNHQVQDFVHELFKMDSCKWCPNKNGNVPYVCEFAGKWVACLFQPQSGGWPRNIRAWLIAENHGSGSGDKRCGV